MEKKESKQKRKCYKFEKKFHFSFKDETFKKVKFINYLLKTHLFALVYRQQRKCYNRCCL